MSNPIIQFPDQLVLISPEDLMRRLGAALERVPGLAYVVIIGARGDPSNLYCGRNVSPSVATEMLHNAASKVGRIITPRG